MTKSKKPEIILIGGAPGTGKTTVAREIARKRGSACFPIDFLAPVFEFLLKSEYVPFLDRSTYEAWKDLKEKIPNEEWDRRFVEGFKAQLYFNSIFITSFIQTLIGYGQSVVLEGVYLIPGYIKDDNYFPRADVRWLILSLSRQAYSDRAEFSPPKLKAVLQIRDYINSLAHKNGVPVVEDQSLKDIIGVFTSPNKG